MNTRWFLALSIASFALPLLLALHSGAWLSAIALLISISISGAYHRSHEANYGRSDAIAAYALIGTNLWYSYRGGFALPFFGMTAFLVCVALYFFYFGQKRDYLLGHSLWHLFSSLITLSSLLTFLS